MDAYEEFLRETGCRLWPGGQGVKPLGVEGALVFSYRLKWFHNHAKLGAKAESCLVGEIFVGCI